MRMKIIGESREGQPTPPSPLSRIAETMLTAMALHDEYEPGVRAIVVLVGEHHDHGEGEPCGVPLGFASDGYTDSPTLLRDLSLAFKVVGAARGVEVEISMYQTNPNLRKRGPR